MASIQSNTNVNDSVNLSDVNGENIHNSSQMIVINLKRSSKKKFGFSITGGSEYGNAIRVEQIRREGSADRDGRLKLYDVIFKVNDISFENISQKKALSVFKAAGKYITMVVQRSTQNVKPDCQPNSTKDPTKHTICGTKIDAVGNRPIYTSIIHPTRASSNSETNFSPNGFPDERIQTQIINARSPDRRRTRTTNEPVKEFEVGTFTDLTRRNQEENNLEILPMIPTNIASRIIPNYQEADEICIALRKSSYSASNIARNQMDALTTSNNSKQILADVFGWGLKRRIIPYPVMLEGIQLHRERYPQIFERPHVPLSNQNNSVIDWSEKDIVTLIPDQNRCFVGTFEEVMKYGNAMKNLPLHVQEFLTNSYRYAARRGFGENTNLSGKYTLHRYIDPLTGKQQVIIICIKLVEVITAEDISDDNIKTKITHVYNSRSEII